MKINWKVRFKNPVFWIGLAGAVMTPILAYSGMSYADLTTWDSIRDLAASVVENPFAPNRTAYQAFPQMKGVKRTIS